MFDNTGECKHIISGYLKCIKLNRGTNDEACRKLAKDYLACRMDKYVGSLRGGAISICSDIASTSQALEQIADHPI